MELRTKPIADSFVSDEHNGPVHTAIYEPGDGTRYVAVVTELTGHLPSSHSCPKVREHLGIPSGGYLVFIEGYGTIVLARRGFLHWSRLQGSLKCSERTAVILGELVGTMIDRPFVSCEMYLSDRAEAV